MPNQPRKKPIIRKLGTIATNDIVETTPVVFKDRQTWGNSCSKRMDKRGAQRLGRTIIYYSWGDQMGTEFLAEACYEGPLAEFLQGLFD